MSVLRLNAKPTIKTKPNQFKRSRTTNNTKKQVLTHPFNSVKLTLTEFEVCNSESTSFGTANGVLRCSQQWPCVSLKQEVIIHGLSLFICPLVNANTVVSHVISSHGIIRCNIWLVNEILSRVSIVPLARECVSLCLCIRFSSH